MIHIKFVELRGTVFKPGDKVEFVNRSGEMQMVGSDVLHGLDYDETNRAIIESIRQTTQSTGTVKTMITFKNVNGDPEVLQDTAFTGIKPTSLNSVLKSMKRVAKNSRILISFKK